MEPAFEPKTICCLQQIFNKTIRREESTEVSVPDGEADPERVIACYANAVLRSKVCRTGSAELTGGIQTEVLYLPSGQTQARSLPVYLPFTAIVDHAQLQPESHLTACVFIRSAEARLVHSGRIQVRVSITLLVRAYRECEESIACSQDLPQTLQIKTTAYPMLLPVDCAETVLRVSEPLALPDSADLRSVCCYTLQPIVTDGKVTGDKAVFQGELRLHLLYGTEKGKLAVYDKTIPFSQYCELGDVYENAKADFCAVLTGCDLQTEGLMDTDAPILSADLLVQCTVSDRISVTLCEDAYDLRGTWQPEWCEYSFRSCLDRQELSASMRGSAEASIGSVLDVTVLHDSPTQEREDDRLLINVPTTAQVLYYDKEGALQRCLLRGYADAETQLERECVCEAVAIPGEATVQYNGSSISAVCPMRVSTESYSDRPCRTMVGGTLLEANAGEKRPAVILRRAGAGESLWEIAKQYRSTVDKIARANKLTEDSVAEPLTVLIPI
ncbi:MAG: DUF3794 domain-containing protein [Oscillospiraceae bacterium]|nr:DUF3794 domain-containing protein [Oscillospiraceae bacterium]